MNESESRLIDAYLDGNLTPEQGDALQTLLRNNPQARAALRRRATIDEGLTDLAAAAASRQTADENSSVPGLARVRGRLAGSSGNVAARWVVFAGWPLAVAAALGLVVSLYLWRQPAEPTIATISGLSGPLQWTGNGGRVYRQLSLGTKLSGGTIDGLSPESWFELEFRDGSTVVISGHSMLAFSDHGQKKLHLKAGNLSASVVPQPRGKPMLIHTRSAVLAVLGTRFDVEAGLSSTVLNVNEGSVNIKRLSDGRDVDVPARHRVIAAADQQLSPIRVPDLVDHWKSGLHLGPARMHGRWSPKTEERDAQLESIPFTTEQQRTIYTAAMPVSSGNSAPVVVREPAHLRVRGYVKTAGTIFFGLTLRESGGDFAGRFQVTRPAKHFRENEEFEVVLALRDFKLDPSLKHMKHTLPEDPFDLMIESIWCHTLYDSCGLAIREVELFLPSSDSSTSTDSSKN